MRRATNEKVKIQQIVSTNTINNHHAVKSAFCNGKQVWGLVGAVVTRSGGDKKHR
jgi:hypothetical protein